MNDSELPKGISGKQESPIPETIVRWELTPEEIANMNESELRQLAIEHQLMFGRLREALEILRLASETNSPVTRADLDVVYSPEKHKEYEHLRDREMQ